MRSKSDQHMGSAGGPIIHIVAGIAKDGCGRVLLVRKRGTAVFMLPGGKPAAGEAPIEALTREVAEEVGCTLVPASAVPLGRFRAPAANEPGHIVEAELFGIALHGTPAPRSEIEELCWLDPQAPGDLPMAALARSIVLPHLHDVPAASD